MVTRSNITRKSMEKVEVDALAWETMLRLSAGDTLEMDGAYIRLMKVLKIRCDELDETPKPLPLERNDWLALALFSKDRHAFVALCEQAERSRDPSYLRARRWLKSIVAADKQRLGE